MNHPEPQPVHRKDYTPPTHWIDSVDLRFELGEKETLVHARLELRRNPDQGNGELTLHGEELSLLKLAVNGKALAAGEYERGEESLTLRGLSDAFVLETTVSIKPQDNTRLSGLYQSSGNFCTQCEAEGFRRITYFLDRPDVMSRYKVRIEGDKGLYPVMLSNGNRIDAGDLAGGRHFVEWEDPHKKPAYLFALVAGNLRCHPGAFKTASGRDVRLEIWVEPQNIDRCEHALRSLQAAMKWDEDVFGLEYDLDLYMIVAVNDFNMGAMENKGLNIFNSKYVLAQPETATDDEYEAIEGVIGHEYFHNWTGNRVTCKDWFQLTLKEGLTVFRDQQFSADQTSRAVKRIDDVRMLRSYQFAEDAGPMAHPIRPESYIEMNNFYTQTVYEKGAEVIRMIHTLLGAEGFRRGMDLYFERHDGQAVSCDDFRAAMADANGVDLAQFERWYDQPGTPVLKGRGSYDAASRTYRLDLTVEAPELAEGVEAPTPRPWHVPVKIGLLGANGADQSVRLGGVTGTEHLLQLKDWSTSFSFEDVPEAPVASILRGFSAPVQLKFERSREDLGFLMAHDSDPFNRWDAGQELATGVLLDLVADIQAGRTLALDPALIEAFRKLLEDDRLDGSLKTMAMSLPSERFLGQCMQVIDPDAIWTAREFCVSELARHTEALLWRLFEANAPEGPYTIDHASIHRRRLRNALLRYLSGLESDAALDAVEKQFDTADNMTASSWALTLLASFEIPARERALEAFYERWKGDPLVLDKWFQIQATAVLPDAVERVIALSKHPDFTLKNPNRARSLIGAFAGGNQLRFHDTSGRGYAFVADQVIAMDALNPQTASRLVSAFNHWKRFDPARQELMRAQLERIAGRDGLSKDVFEIVQRSLGREAAPVA